MMWGHWISKTWAQPARSQESGQDRQYRQVQYHLGRGRRAREAGKPALGVLDARRAATLDPANPWAFALLGQCLLRLGRLADARAALERARALDPANGYFVRLSLDVLYAQHDARGRADLLNRAWWAGAPVERWLPGGPPQAPRHVQPQAADRPETPMQARPHAANAAPVPA
ncbi:MAG: tetratricopeptide repeat protein [Chloroflexi bacterium]|nr:tetratricopeptide repeat protein [Chloroflexota bacterium]